MGCHVCRPRHRDDRLPQAECQRPRRSSRVIQNAIDIPGYLEAVEAERITRDASFLPVIESVNGFPVTPLTLRQYLALRVIDSPMLPPFQTPSPHDLAAFLWLLNPGYCQDARKRARFLKTCRKFSVIRCWTKRGRAKALQIAAVTVDAVRRFVAEALQDRPPRNGSSRIQEKDFYSDGCSICAALAREYGWSEKEILDMPIKRLFQYMNEMKAHSSAMRGELPVLGNPSDGVISQHLENVNRKN